MEDKNCPEYKVCKLWNSANCDQCMWKKLREENDERRRKRFEGIDISTDGEC